MFANGDHMGLESLIFSFAILFTRFKYFFMLLIVKVLIELISYLYIDDSLVPFIVSSQLNNALPSIVRSSSIRSFPNPGVSITVKIGED